MPQIDKKISIFKYRFTRPATPDRIAESVSYRRCRPSLSLDLSTLAVSSVLDLSVRRSRLPVGRLPVGRPSVRLVRPSIQPLDGQKRPRRPKRGHPGGDGWPPDGLLDTSTRPTAAQMPPQMPHLRRCADCVRLRGCGLDLACVRPSPCESGKLIWANKTRGLRVILPCEKKSKYPIDNRR